MPRTLISDDGITRVYTVTDAQGKAIGTDVEKVPTPEDVNRAALTAQATAVFITNRAAIAASNPTNAQLIQQVKNLSAQNNAIMRLLLGLLDGTD